MIGAGGEMNCPNCGNAVADGAPACATCGTQAMTGGPPPIYGGQPQQPFGQPPPYAPPGYGVPPYAAPPVQIRQSGMAIAGFVLSFFCGPLGLIFSIIGYNECKSSGGTVTGEGLAVAGICISIVSMLIGIAMVASK